MVVAAAERAYDYTRAAILSGAFPAGELISEGQVAGALGVSRTPVREAFLRLEAERFLRLFPKRGALVSPITPGEAAEVLEARQVIELWAVTRLRGLRPDARADLVRELRSNVAAQRRAVEDADTVEFQSADGRFHVAIIRSTGNTVMTDFYRSLRDRQLRIGIASVIGSAERTDEVITQHLAIVDAIDAAELDALPGLVRGHLDATRNAVGLRAYEHDAPEPGVP